MKRQSVREAFDLNRWRLRSADEIACEVGAALTLMDGDDTQQEAGAARLRDVLRFAPYHVATLEALAGHAKKKGVETPTEARLEDGQDLCSETVLDRSVQGTAFVRWPEERTPLVRRAYERFLAEVDRACARFDVGIGGLADVFLARLTNPFCFDDEMVGAYFPFAALHQLFADLAPHVEDTRFVIYTQSVLDEVWLVGGEAWVVRHGMISADPAYFDELAAEVPDDRCLRAYLVHEWTQAFEGALGVFADDAYRRKELIRRYGPSASQLHDLDQPGTTARLLDEARRALERVRELGGKVDALRAKLDKLSPRRSAADARALGRYDVAVKYAKSLIEKEDYRPALRAIEIATDLEPPWYEETSLLRGMALDGLGRSRAALGAYEDHAKRLVGRAPYDLLTHAWTLARRRRAAGAEILYRELFGAAFWVGVAARVGAAEVRDDLGDPSGAEALYVSAIEAAAVAKALHAKTSIGSEIDGYEGRARRALAARGKPARAPAAKTRRKAAKA